MIEAFLEAMLAEPQDEIHRLVFADWLEEHDDPRAKRMRTLKPVTHVMRPDGFDSHTHKNIRVIDKGGEVPGVLMLPQHGDGKRGLHGAELRYAVHRHGGSCVDLSVGSWERLEISPLKFATVWSNKGVEGHRSLHGFPIASLHVDCDADFEVEFQVRLFEDATMAARSHLRAANSLWHPSSGDNGFGFFCRGWICDPKTAIRVHLRSMFPDEMLTLKIEQVATILDRS